MIYFNLYVALGVLLITGLAMNVSRIRISQQIGNGDGDYGPLKKAMRAHMNTIEHVVPFALILFSLVHLELGPALLAVCCFGFIGVRLLHSYGMLSPAFKVRQLSAALTYGFEVVGCVLILVNVW
ncbi:MAG: hypothetical protein COB04_14555 [Gammaproteobacteria bacterium]|nr:MAG: hypothetical protein COB04_14555 [Gammaproteobacteria bacterium]